MTRDRSTREKSFGYGLIYETFKYRETIEVYLWYVLSNDFVVFGKVSNK